MGKVLVLSLALLSPSIRKKTALDRQSLCSFYSLDLVHSFS